MFGQMWLKSRFVGRVGEDYLGYEADVTVGSADVVFATP